jgi:DNA-binding NarL/FixJ family response regulator
MVVMIRVLIVNEIFLLCDVLAAVLEDESDMQVVGYALTVNDAINLAPTADVILVNIRPSDGIALDLIGKVMGARLPAKVVVLGLSDTADEVIRYIQAGAAGYVLEDNSVDELLERIRDTCAGCVRASPWITAAVVSRIKDYANMLSWVEAGAGDVSQLTTREREIIELISQKLTNQQIAERLIIEIGTVKNHVHNILKKMDASTRHEAAVNWSVVRSYPRGEELLLE